MKFVIEKNLLEITLQYLSQRPYREVAELVQALARLQVLEESKTKEGNQ